MVASLYILSPYYFMIFVPIQFCRKFVIRRRQNHLQCFWEQVPHGLSYVFVSRVEEVHCATQGHFLCFTSTYTQNYWYFAGVKSKKKLNVYLCCTPSPSCLLMCNSWASSWYRSNCFIILSCQWMLLSSLLSFATVCSLQYHFLYELLSIHYHFSDLLWQNTALQYQQKGEKAIYMVPPARKRIQMNASLP